MTSVQEHAKQVALVQSWYADQPMSLHLYGSRFGKTFFARHQELSQAHENSVTSQ
jgi:hypothetical protein